MCVTDEKHYLYEMSNGIQLPFRRRCIRATLFSQWSVLHLRTPKVRAKISMYEVWTVQLRFRWTREPWQLKKHDQLTVLPFVSTFHRNPLTSPQQPVYFNLKKETRKETDLFQSKLFSVLVAGIIQFVYFSNKRSKWTYVVTVDLRNSMAQYYHASGLINCR